MLNETQSILYHWTTPERMKNIAKTGQLQGTNEESVLNNRKSDSDFNICFTRHRSNKEGYGMKYAKTPNICLMTFDSTYINGKIMPFDWYAEMMFKGDTKNPDFRNGRICQSRGEVPQRVIGNMPNFLNQAEERLFEKSLDIKNSLELVEITLNWQTNQLLPFNSIQELMVDFEDKVLSNEGNVNEQRKAYNNVLLELSSIDRNSSKFTTLINTIQRHLDVPIITYWNYKDFDAKKPCDYKQSLKDLYNAIEHIIALKPYFEDKELTKFYDVNQTRINDIKRHRKNY